MRILLAAAGAVALTAAAIAQAPVADPMISAMRDEAARSSKLTTSLRSLPYATPTGNSTRRCGFVSVQFVTLPEMKLPLGMMSSAP